MEIVPQSINLFPEDQQYFTITGSPPPVIWVASSNATIASDHTLNLTPGVSGAGLIGQLALSGIAGIRWTFDSQMLPTSTGKILLRITGAGSHALIVTVNPTSTVARDENANTIATISRTVASGDEYYLEVAGNLLRLFINGQVSAEYTATGATRYPIRAGVDYTQPYASGSPHITVPAFVGNWSAATDDTATITNTWTPYGGSLDDATDKWKVLYTAGTSPGAYTLTTQINSSSYQEAQSLIVIEPLSIDGPIAVTLQPSEVVRFRTNYDRAQKKLVTWAVVSGSGSFTNDYFTAPSAPGTTVVKATYSTTQDARITITIPAVMTLTNPSSLSVDAAKLGEVLTLTTNMTGTINWTATIGTLSASSGSSVTWTAPNQAGLTAKITATNGTYTVSQEIRVLNHFSYNPNTPLNWEDKRTLLVSRAEDRTVSFRIKDADEETYQAHEWDFRNRTVSEYGTVRTFWQNQYGKLPFIWDSPFRSVRHVFYFDSDIKAQATAGGCGVDYSFRVVEA